MWRGATFVTQSRVYETRGSILETKLEHAVCFVNINTTRARFLLPISTEKENSRILATCIFLRI